MPKAMPTDRCEPFKEWLEGVENERTKRYIQERVIKQMDWYRTKSYTCKRNYQCWMTVSIILSGVIPVASIFANGDIVVKALIAALGAAVTGINAYLSFQNYKNLWNTYRRNRELLLSTIYLYFNNAGIFGKETDQDKRDEMLIDVCEKSFQQEITDWREIMK